MIFLKLILTNLRRHRVRTLIGVAGISFSVAAMLTVITILQGAIGMFERILSNDSEIIVFERNVSDLFFSSVPDEAVAQMNHWSIAQHANPVLFGIVSSAEHPVITCFGVIASDSRIRDATWLAGCGCGRSPRGRTTVNRQPATKAGFDGDRQPAISAVVEGAFYEPGDVEP
jgi:putative ABC transport system permease protein